MGAKLCALVALAGAVVIGAPNVALADEPSPAAVAQAREDFRKGLALEAAGDWGARSRRSAASRS